MAAKGYGNADLAVAVNVGARTVTNWRTGETMPQPAELEKLRRLFPGYDSPGDPVEIALNSSELVEWRRDTVRGFYKRHLAEQREERGETA